ncbi:hypothetical protein ACFYRN_45195 [Streptomyces sp. NPDC005227]|uniref:hypothetical protein n=1 Tax=Streptomyces sp. NPDC005227 TaxID=3364707 RepID=UPI0036B70AE2
MGWSGANGVFDPVAKSLIDAGVDDTVKRTVLGGLIKGLQDGDWDTEDESLEDFLHDPAVVGAFADHGVHLSDRRCCLREPGADVGALLVRHLVDGGLDKDVAVAHVDAYGRHLADRIRACRDETRGATQAGAVMDFAADLIDPSKK